MKRFAIVPLFIIAALGAAHSQLLVVNEHEASVLTSAKTLCASENSGVIGHDPVTDEEALAFKLAASAAVTDTYKGTDCLNADLVLRIILNLQTEIISFRVYSEYSGELVWDNERSITDQNSDLERMALTFREAVSKLKNGTARAALPANPGDKDVRCADGYVFNGRTVLCEAQQH